MVVWIAKQAAVDVFSPYAFVSATQRLNDHVLFQVDSLAEMKLVTVKESQSIQKLQYFEKKCKTLQLQLDSRRGVNQL